MAAPFLPGLVDLDEQEAWVVQDVSPTRQRRREPRSRTRKPATEINFLAQLEQREFQPGRDEIAGYEEVAVQEPKSKPEPGKRSGATTGKRSKPEGASKPEGGAPKRIRPPAKSRAKPQVEVRPAAQRQQKGVLLIRPQPKAVRGKGASAVGPDPAAGDDSATESEGEMARRALKSSVAQPEQGGGAAAGKSSSSTSHTVSSSCNREVVNDAAREQAIQERKKLLKGIAATFRDECVLLSRKVLSLQRQWKQELQTPHPGLGTVTTLGDDGAKGQAPKSRARDKRVLPASARKKPASRTVVTYDPTRNRIAEV